MKYRWSWKARFCEIHYHEKIIGSWRSIVFVVEFSLTHNSSATVVKNPHNTDEREERCFPRQLHMFVEELLCGCFEGPWFLRSKLLFKGQLHAFLYKRMSIFEVWEEIRSNYSHSSGGLYCSASLFTGIGKYNHFTTF